MQKANLSFKKKKKKKKMKDAPYQTTVAMLFWRSQSQSLVVLIAPKMQTHIRVLLTN